MLFSDAIRELRRKCLLSQHDFADALGVSSVTVNRWECGKSKPNYKAMKRIDNYCKLHKIDFNIAEWLEED